MYVGGNRRWVAAVLWRARIYFTFTFPYHSSCFHKISGYSFTRLKRTHYFGMELQEKVEQV